MIISIFIERSAIKRFSFIINSEGSSAQLELEKHLSKAYKRLYDYLRKKLFQFSPYKQTVQKEETKVFCFKSLFFEEIFVCSN